MTPMFKDLYEFVMANKSDKTFIGYSDMRIAGMLKEGLDAGTLFYATSPDNKIVGMILAIKDPVTGVLFVTENLSMSLSNLKMFARKAREMFKGYKLEAMRHGKHRQFNTDKLYTKLT